MIFRIFFISFLSLTGIAFAEAPKTKKMPTKTSISPSSKTSTTLLASVGPVGSSTSSNTPAQTSNATSRPQPKARKIKTVSQTQAKSEAPVKIEKSNNNEQIWKALAKSFELQKEINRPEVDKHVKQLVKNKAQLQRLMSQAGPYLYYVMKKVKEQGLPGEIALIPVVESAFNPFATSHVGAEGLWQLMPPTAKELGVTYDAWFNGRRDIIQSTDASLKYFNYLKRFFKGNWSQAIAAYNAGQGRVRNAIKKNQANKKDTQFWSLRLPKETRNYVPKVYALARIIQSPEKYKVTLPAIPNKPYFEFVKLDKSIELAKIAKLANMNLKDVKKLNAGHKKKSTKPKKTHNIALPVTKVSVFKQNLQKVENQQNARLV